MLYEIKGRFRENGSKKGSKSMRVTTYTCDKCGKSSTESREIELETVGVFVGSYQRHYTYGQEPRVELTKEWCKECRIKAGLIEKPKNSTAEVTPTTLEDMVREIVREEIGNQ